MCFIANITCVFYKDFPSDYFWSAHLNNPKLPISYLDNHSNKDIINFYIIFDVV